jgi:hypothetical protein
MRSAALLSFLAGIASLDLFLRSAPACAATAAYWRHEEGPAGGLIPDGPETVLDSSGNGNHMQTFASAFDPYTSATYTASVPPLALRSGLVNTLALDFGTGSDGTTPPGAEPNDDNYSTPDKPINSQVFTAMTVELAFNMKSVGPGQFQALFGKDGKPLGDAPGEPDSPIPPFKVMVRGDAFPNDIPNQLFVEWIDGDGDIHFLAGGETIATNTWHHVAFTLNSTDAQLWIAGTTGPYAMADSKADDYSGPADRVIIEEPLGFTIGRGMYNNGVTDWSNAIIDEVRVSDTVLASNQFLFVTAAGGGDADFDDDQDVDGNDFLRWQRGLGSPGTNANGDANGDGQVNATDLAIWKTAFGGPAATAVPEPSSVLLGLGAGLFCRRWRKAA